MKFISLFLTFVILSCAKNDASFKKNGTPEWFLEPDKTTVFEVYGVGASTSRDDAINIALTNAVGKIRTNVSSIVKTEAQIIGGKTSEEMQTRVINEVEKFALSGYENTKLEMDKKTKIYYAEVKINKVKIYTQKLTEYENKMDEIQNSFEIAKTGSLFNRLNLAKKLSLQSENLVKDASILYALNNIFPYKAELGKISKYKNCREELLTSINFKTSKMADKNEEKAVNAALTKKKLRVNSHGRDFITVDFIKSGETSKGKVYGLFFAKTNGIISLKNDLGEVLKERQITYGATSTISEAEAYKESLKDLTNKFSDILDEIL